jgi:hypothetical protein
MQIILAVFVIRLPFFARIRRHARKKWQVFGKR